MRQILLTLFFVLFFGATPCFAQFDHYYVLPYQRIYYNYSNNDLPDIACRPDQHHKKPNGRLIPRPPGKRNPTPIPEDQLPTPIPAPDQGLLEKIKKLEARITELEANAAISEIALKKQQAIIAILRAEKVELEQKLQDVVEDTLETDLLIRELQKQIKIFEGNAQEHTEDIKRLEAEKTDLEAKLREALDQILPPVIPEPEPDLPPDVVPDLKPEPEPEIIPDVVPDPTPDSPATSEKSPGIISSVLKSLITTKAVSLISGLGLGIFGSAGVFGVLYIVGRFWRRKKTVDTVATAVDRVQDRVEDKVSDVTNDAVGDATRQVLEEIESRIVKRIDASIDQQQTDIDIKINERIPVGLVDKVFDIIKEWRSQPAVESKPAEPAVEEKKDVISPQVHPRIMQWAELKRSEGESLEHWAALCALYKEAVNELRAGKLYYKGGVKLQGQGVTADKLDSWVKTEYINRMTTDQMKFSNLWHEAYIGYLYKDAVDALRKGEIEVLGAENTADSIETWVHARFIEKTTGNKF
ncbi:MAG: hypothetical protein ACYSUK_00250 [Planctomycetota bacterium]|jgi:hypothetical protein